MSIPSSTRAVVTGIGGIQNRAIARALAAGGFAVTGLGRSPTAPEQLPAGITYHSADPTNADALTRAFDGAAVVVLTSPIDHRPGVRERLVETVVNAALRAGIGRIVFNAAAAVFDDRNHPVARVLGALGEAVLAGPVPGVVLQPTVYMDNLLAPWAAPGIVNEGVLAYPMPEEAPVSWISHDSLGAFVLAAATRDVAGRTFRIGGAEALTGPEVAAILTRALGRAVRYVPIPPAVLAEGMNAVYGAPAGDDIASLYSTLADQPMLMRRDPAGWADLEVTPERFEDWALRQSWPRQP